MSCYTVHIMLVKVEYWMILMLRCACAGSSNEVKTEADSGDISEHPRDVKPRPFSCDHMNIHTGKYKCAECGRCCYTNQHLAIHRRSHSNVTCVRKHLLSLQLCTDTWESTREINHTSVHCVTKVSTNPATCSYINVVYTAREDRMTVLTVGSCLRQTVIWSVVCVFTLVQSRTDVDTVHSVLQGLTNSRDICWSHTMKVLGWRVTFVRRNLVKVVILNSIYFDMMVWSLMYVVSVQSVSEQCMNWNFISWYTQTTNSFAGIV